jgi:hypothetical protein
MSAVVACVVCARPLDSLLTSGLQAGVLVLAVVALAVIGALARGAVRLLREDAADERDAAGPDVRAPVREAGGQP